MKRNARGRSLALRVVAARRDARIRKPALAASDPAILGFVASVMSTGVVCFFSARSTRAVVTGAFPRVPVARMTGGACAGVESILREADGLPASEAGSDAIHVSENDDLPD